MKPGTKYYPLYNYLQARAEDGDATELTFGQIEAILDASLPATARKSRSWWANSRTSGRVQAAAWMEAGLHVDAVDLEQERVVFKRPAYPYRLASDSTELEWNPETIRALRQYMGLTQQELAERLNMRQQTISEWETGMYKPRGGSIALLNMVAERAGFYDAVSRQPEDPDSEP